VTLPDIRIPELPAAAARYDIDQSYDWNYDNAPLLPQDYVRHEPASSWTLCGVPVNSPIGIAAGPLLNGRWVLHYAAQGFDLLTYKTVRSKAWPCYALPNLQPIEDQPVLVSPSKPIAATRSMSGSWAVSFGMPSKSPDLWRFDVEETRRLLPAEKKLSVSVVATPESGWTIDEVADDYARCARWAVGSGADFIEINLSCPNVSSCDGQLYQDASKAALVCARVKSVIGDTPLLVKVGQVVTRDGAAKLVRELEKAADALVMINCIAARVHAAEEPMFDGQPRGIAGRAIQRAVLDQVAMFSQVIDEQQASLEVVGVGGIRDNIDVGRCLQAGARCVQVATAIMQ